MRSLIITAFTSVDGVMEAPGGEAGYRNAGWTGKVEFDPAVYEIKGREQDEAGALLLGRVSYQAFAPVWPTMTAEFAGYNAMPRFVVSTTLDSDDERWPATVLRSLDDVAALKEGDGGPLLVHGSATLGAALSDAGLVDRYHLLVFPFLLGAGKRLFSDSDVGARMLQLVEYEAYPNGVQKQVFDVVR